MKNVFIFICMGCMTLAKAQFNTGPGNTLLTPAQRVNLVSQASATSQPLLIELQLKDEKKRRNTFGRGAWIGGLAGMGLGSLIGFFDGDDPDNQLWSYTAGEKAMILGGSFSLIGAVLGGTLLVITRKKPAKPDVILQ